MARCHGCRRRGKPAAPLRQVPGTTLLQCPRCDAAVPVPLAPAPHDATERRSPRAVRGKEAA